MTYRQLLAKVANPALSILLVLATACTHQSQPKQERLPPRTQDRPLQDRIKSQERPERESWQKPDEVVRALALTNGEVVADIGAGTGYFTRRIANRIDFYRRMAPGLKEHGRLAIIDYSLGAEHAPHPPEQLVPPSQVINEAEEAGFKFVKDFQFLPRQYFLLFEKR